MKILELGCGLNKREGAIGVDNNPRSAADVIHDLNVHPYPFDADEFDEVLCHDVLEHLDDVPAAIAEIHRVVKNGGVVRIQVPFPSGSNFHTDITHRRAFTSRSFDYFVPGTDLYDRYRYSDVRFELLACRYHPPGGRKSLLRKLLIRWAERNKELYERKYMFLVPMEDISFELRAIK